MTHARPASGLAAELETTPYRHVSVLARGGMGEVHVVEHAELGTLRVMKLLRQDVAEAANLAIRLRVEARLLTRLDHPRLVRVLDFGWTASRRPYLITELLKGQSLGAVLRATRKLPVDLAVRFAIETLDGLMEVHRAGVVHRDIKPDNLFVVGRGGELSIKILDFGIAKMLSPEDAAASGAQRTATGMIVGTPTYVSPEQIRADRDIDARADQYGVACVLFAMLAGRPPFVKATPMDVMGAHLAEAAPSVALFCEAPRALSDVVTRALAKWPAERFASAEEMAEALRASMPPSGVGAAPPKPNLAPPAPPVIASGDDFVPRGKTVRIAPPPTASEPTTFLPQNLARPAAPPQLDPVIAHAPRDPPAHTTATGSAPHEGSSASSSAVERVLFAPITLATLIGALAIVVLVLLWLLVTTRSLPAQELPYDVDREADADGPDR